MKKNVPNITKDLFKWTKMFSKNFERMYLNKSLVFGCVIDFDASTFSIRKDNIHYLKGHYI